MSSPPEPTLSLAMPPVAKVDALLQVVPVRVYRYTCPELLTPTVAQSAAATKIFVPSATLPPSQ